MLAIKQDGNRKSALSLDVRADGNKQVLSITNYNADVSLYKPRQRSMSLTSARQDTISSSGDGFEVVNATVQPTLTFSIEFSGIGISLVNRRLLEIV